MSTGVSTETTGLSPGRIDEIRLAELVQQLRVTEARISDLLLEVEQTGTYAEDGHLSVKSWARAIGNWSSSETVVRIRRGRALRDLPAMRAAFREGRLGVAQANPIGRAHSNPRVRHLLPDSEPVLLPEALALPADDFDIVMKRWTDLGDADGARRRHDDAHQQRHASITDVGDETVMQATCGTGRGEVMKEIFNAFCDAEFAADLEAAGAGKVLPRTDAQRRADALFQIFLAAAEGGRGGTLNINVNFVIDDQTFEDEVKRAYGAHVDPVDPSTVMSRRCEGMSGTVVSPADVLAAGLIGTIRRVVIDSASVVIDLGRQRRFVRAARDALLLRDHHCTFIGCQVPSAHCEGDHVHDYGWGGLTNPANGGLQCPRHNRLKNSGYRTVRDAAGRWRTYRPDGSEVGRPELVPV